MWSFQRSEKSRDIDAAYLDKQADLYEDHLVPWRAHQSLHNLISFNFGVKWVCRGAGALDVYTSGYVRECSAKRGGIAKRARREGVLLSIVFHDFCQLPDCLKGLGCTIPFIHCSPTFTIRHRRSMPVISSSSRGYSLFIIDLHLLRFTFLYSRAASRISSRVGSTTRIHLSVKRRLIQNIIQVALFNFQLIRINCKQYWDRNVC